MIIKTVYTCFTACFLTLTTLATDVNILQFGAVADGKTLNTVAIQKAIDSCSKTGGGKVTVPFGVFITGQLSLYSNIELHLQAGAILKGSSSMLDYPNKSFLIAKKCSNVQLTGLGTIDGSGDSFYDKNYQPLDRPVPFILLEDCSFIKIRDVKLINSPSHVMRILNCSEVLIDGIYLQNPEQSPNTDGIDIVDTKNVYISNSTIITGDDAICLKNHGGKVENVTVKNCMITSDDGGIKLGTGSKDTIQHCTFSNIVIRNTRYALAMFMQEGGVYRFISFNNITIQTGGRQKNVYPVFFDIDKKRVNEKLGVIENISLSNLQIETSGNILIAGQPSAPIQNLSLNNITMVVRNCNDVTKYKKPRGNKSTPYFADMKDLSNIPAHITLGYINRLSLKDIKITDECSVNKRPPYYKTSVVELK